MPPTNQQCSAASIVTDVVGSKGQHSIQKFENWEIFPDSEKIERNAADASDSHESSDNGLCRGWPTTLE